MASYDGQHYSINTALDDTEYRGRDMLLAGYSSLPRTLARMPVASRLRSSW